MTEFEFEWDENKRLAVLTRRGVDFRRVAYMFNGPLLTKPDGRRDYGEDRFISIGMIEKDCYVAVHTRRGTTVRIISAWKGGRREQREYHASLDEGDSPDVRARRLRKND